MQFNSCPMNLASFLRVVENRDEDVSNLLQFDLSRPTRFNPGNQGINAASIKKFDP